MTEVLRDLSEQVRKSTVLSAYQSPAQVAVSVVASMGCMALLQVVAEMSKAERSALMKFATSVSRAPLGGFKHLNPPLTVHKAGPLSPDSIAALTAATYLQ